MMAASRKELIQKSLVDRLKTITTTNGYDTNVQKVFSDEIPMGLSLDDFELPAILVISSIDNIKHQLKWLVGNWEMELQLIHRSNVGDSEMLRFVRDVNKAVFANSPTLNRNDAWREFDGKPTAVWIKTLDTDLNMIDANRFSLITYVIEYHSQPTDL